MSRNNAAVQSTMKFQTKDTKDSVHMVMYSFCRKFVPLGTIIIIICSIRRYYYYFVGNFDGLCDCIVRISVSLYAGICLSFPAFFTQVPVKPIPAIQYPLLFVLHRNLHSMPVSYLK